MDWIKLNRVPIKISLSNSKSSNNLKGTQKWESIRKTILNRDNSTCRYCGGQYLKYLHCIHIDKNKSNNNLENLSISCKGCYIITHVDFSFNDDIVLCWSLTSQVDIIRNTVDFVIKNGHLPQIKEIDPDAKKINLSVFEYSCLISSFKKKYIPNEFNNYKIFFTSNLDTSFIEDNYCDDEEYMFVDTDDYSMEIDNSKSLNVDDGLDIHQFTDNEKIFLQKNLYDTDINLNNQYNELQLLSLKNKINKNNNDINFNLINKKYQHV
jgi:hypothetical protein